MISIAILPLELTGLDITSNTLARSTVMCFIAIYKFLFALYNLKKSNDQYLRISLKM